MFEFVCVGLGDLVLGLVGWFGVECLLLFGGVTVVIATF